MEQLKDKLDELVELARDMTEEEYKNWKRVILRQCPAELLEVMKALFAVVEEGR